MRWAAVIIGLLLLFGIASATTWTSAGGCWTATNGSYTIVKWNATGTSTWVVPSTVDNITSYLVVGGGGAGGNGTAFGGIGGGGAGGVNASLVNLSVTPGETITIVVGAGGVNTPDDGGMRGQNSSFKNVFAWRGGGGSHTATNRTGGSSGGGSYDLTSAAAGVSGQGQAGGGAYYATGHTGGGGGGNATAGATGIKWVGGNGGNGGYYIISGENTAYAGGGGGNVLNNASGIAGVGGVGGGGSGSATGAGVAGTPETGSGGGAGAYVSSTGYTGGVGGSGVVIIQYYTPPTPPVEASFTQSVNPSTAGQVVTFTDTSTGTPTTWNWTIDGSVTNTTQNAAYLFAAVGTYPVNLNVTNASGHFSDITVNQIVANASITTQQDVWMVGQYLQTFTISDSGTLAPITNVTIVSSSGKSYVTTNGTGYLTEPFGLYTVTFSSTGYAPRTITYVFDADASHAVSMTPAAADASSSYNTWYTPWQVRIRIVDLYGKPLPETSVSASYIATTLPSTDPTWLVGAYGVSAAVAADMLNSSVAMSGTTDDNGGLVFTAFKSIQYLFTITNTTSGVSATKKIYPSDPEYVIYVRTTGQTSYNNTLASRNASLPWYSINSTALMMGMEYTDSSLCTSQVMFRVWFRDNGTEVHNTTWSGFGGTKIMDNHTILKAPIGTEYLWGYNATTVC